MLGCTREDETQHRDCSLYISRLYSWAHRLGRGWHSDPDHPAALLSSALDPKFLEPWALLLDQHKLGEGRDRTSNMVLPFLSSPEAGGVKEGCGSRNGVLTKFGISSKLQDLLILWGKEVLRGARALSPAPCP